MKNHYNGIVMHNLTLRLTW